MYHLRINDKSLFFHYWMGVVEYFENKGLTDKDYLNTAYRGGAYIGNYNFYLHQIVDMGVLHIKNPSLCEEGDDYVIIELEQIKFSDTK